MRYRFPVTLVAAAGIGGLVAITVAIALLIGLGSATENTRRLLSVRADDLLDSVEQRIDSRLQPVVSQGAYIAALVRDGRLAIDGPSSLASLDRFMIGALAGTPQVAGIAVVLPEGASRRWTAGEVDGIDEDWSARVDTMEWVEFLAAREGSTWSGAFFTPTLDAFVLLHSIALRRDGDYRAALGQVIRISRISEELTDLVADSLLVPFVLEGNGRVLAHPSLAANPPTATEEDSPLPSVRDVNDPVLTQFSSPAAEPVYMLGRSERTEASMVTVDGRDHIFLYRSIGRYDASATWTAGVHFALDVESDTVVDRLFVAAVSGLVIFLVSVAAAVVLAHKLNRPVRDIAAVAKDISGGDFAQVKRLPRSRLKEVDDASQALNQMVRDLEERQTMRATLGRYVPEQVARTLLRDGGALGVETGEATILFCDIEGFTGLTQSIGPANTVALLNEFFGAMVDILERHGGVVTQFQGDAILATFNLPVADPAHAANAIAAAREMVACAGARAFGGAHLGLRIGIDTGQVMAGAVGATGRLSYTVHGDAVNLAARLERHNKLLGTQVAIAVDTVRRAGRRRGRAGQPRRAAAARSCRDDRGLQLRCGDGAGRPNDDHQFVTKLRP